MTKIKKAGRATSRFFYTRAPSAYAASAAESGASSGVSAIGKPVCANKMPFTVAGTFESKSLSQRAVTGMFSCLRLWLRPGGVLSAGRRTAAQGTFISKEFQWAAPSHIQGETEPLLREHHKIKTGEPDNLAVRNVSQRPEAGSKAKTIISVLR